MSWIDLNLINSKNFIDYINYQIISVDYKFFIEYFFENNKIVKKYVVEDDNKNFVEINFFVNNLVREYIFNNYLPLKLEFLVNILKTTFEYLPNILSPFKFEILSLFYGINWRYEYKKSFEFDLYNGNIDDLFDEKID